MVNLQQTKLNEDGSRKVSQIIKQVILNAATSDGIEPAEELTPFAKDALTSSGDTPLTMLKILFKKQKTRATATPRFISAMRKGNLTYENGIPDNFSITQLPQTLQGTPVEKLDIGRMLNMDENGTITENDTNTMHKSVLPVSRTMHFLQDKMKAFQIVVGEYFGTNSWVYNDATMWVTWIEDNFSTLQEIRAQRDQDLPVKIEIAISDRFNRIFNAAIVGIPDESLFDNRILDGILLRTTYLELPSAVREAISSNKRRQEAQPTNQNQNRRQRQGIARVNHENHPLELKMLSDQYRSNVTPYIQTHKDKVPKFDDNTDECLKFCFLGYCNEDCPRSKAHVAIKRGTKRFDILTKLKSSCMQSNKPTPDFQKGEEQ